MFFSERVKQKRRNGDVELGFKLLDSGKLADFSVFLKYFTYFAKSVDVGI